VHSISKLSSGNPPHLPPAGVTAHDCLVATAAAAEVFPQPEPNCTESPYRLGSGGFGTICPPWRRPFGIATSIEGYLAVPLQRRLGSQSTNHGRLTSHKRRRCRWIAAIAVCAHLALVNGTPNPRFLAPLQKNLSPIEGENASIESRLPTPRETNAVTQVVNEHPGNRAKP